MQACLDTQTEHECVGICVMQSGLLNQVPFDPLGLRNEDTQEKEIKNGRLAMVAFVGFASQAAVQGKGPIESLKYHLADPIHHNSEDAVCLCLYACLKVCSTEQYVSILIFACVHHINLRHNQVFKSFVCLTHILLLLLGVLRRSIDVIPLICCFVTFP